MVNQTDIMIDIESLNTRSSAVVLSVGAVAFQYFLTGEKQKYETFHEIVGTKELREEQMMFGRTTSKDTIAWWKKQSAEAKKIFKTKTCDSTFEMLEKLTAFVKAQHPKAHIWCNGANFDGVILRELYEDLGMECPWQFRQERCYRTYIKTNSRIVDKLDFVGVKHDALADALYQTNNLMHIRNKNVGNAYP